MQFPTDSVSKHVVHGEDAVSNRFSFETRGAWRRCSFQETPWSTVTGSTSMAPVPRPTLSPNRVPSGWRGGRLGGVPAGPGTADDTATDHLASGVFCVMNTSLSLRITNLKVFCGSRWNTSVKYSTAPPPPPPETFV